MPHRPAHPVLDDEFFSIDEFNRETEEMEALSRSRGQLNEDEDEGEEGVDLFGNVEDVENFEEEDEEGEANGEVVPSCSFN
jgi:U3 small nucleolar RNA-associated protein MPP10